MRRESIWCEGISFETRASLNKDIICDTLIIGGGIAGMSVAFNLKDMDDVVLIDKGKVSFGVTSHTTGKLTFLQGSLLYDIKKSRGTYVLNRYLESQKHAIKMALDNILKYDIDCDLERSDSYLFSVYDDIDEYRKILDECGIKYENEKLPIFNCKDSLKVFDTYVFHPLKYVLALKDIVLDSGVKIYENTTAYDIDFDGEYVVKTSGGDIRAKRVIVCTHYPFFVWPGLFPFKLGLKQSYALSSCYENKMFNAINVDKDVYSIRFYKDNIIFGGFSHDLSTKINYEQEQERLISCFLDNFNLGVDYVWMTHDLHSFDYLPIVGNIRDNLYIATAFNKWGMTNGILAGKILGDLVLGKKNEFASLFKPSRSFNLEVFKNFCVNNLKIGSRYALSWLDKNKSFYNRGYVTNIDGKMRGVYIDGDGVHIVSNICPHLKCRLIFNNADKTWDCPCHGSRFDTSGNVLEGPSSFSIKIK